MSRIQSLFVQLEYSKHGLCSSGFITLSKLPLFENILLQNFHMLIFVLRNVHTNVHTVRQIYRSSIIVSRTFNWLEIEIVKQGGFETWCILELSKCFNETYCIGHILVAVFGSLCDVAVG